MWKRLAKVALIAVASVAAVTTRVRAEELYHVNLSPPSHVGQEFNYTASEREESLVSIGPGVVQQVPGHDFSSVDFQAIVKVDAVDDRGAPSRLRLNAVAGIVPAHTEITVRSAQVQESPPKYMDVFSEADAPCHPAVANVLRRVVTLGGETESTEQQAFGTDKSLPIGGSWSLDGEPGARLFAKLHVTAAPKDVSGTAKLVGITRHDKTECLEVRMTVSCNNVPAESQPGERINAATATAELTYYIARDGGRVVDARCVNQIVVELQVKTGDNAHTERRTRKVIRRIQISDVPKDQPRQN